MTQLVTQQGGWPLQPDLCPFDLDLISWFDTADPGPLFHMGPGLHHAVGRYLASRQRVCLSVTVSTAEVDAYMEWAIENPIQASLYQCLFADVQAINWLLLPHGFAVVSLPHLGEMPDARRDEYGQTAEATLATFVDMLWVHGMLIVYPGSSAYDRIEPAIQLLCQQAILIRAGDYKSIRIYRKL